MIERVVVYGNPGYSRVVEAEDAERCVQSSGYRGRLPNEVLNANK